MPPLKILFLFEDLCFGGTQKQNLALAKRLDRQLFAPSLLTLTGPTDLDAEANGLPLRHLGVGRKAPALFFLKLPQVLAQMAPDILFLCTALPNIWGRIWGKLTKVPLIIGTCRGGGAPMRQHEWLLWRMADGIICNSVPLRGIMQSKGMPADKLAYIANGVDTDHFTPPPHAPDGQLILNVARLAKDKDHLTLLRAFAQIADEFPSSRLRIVGEGPEDRAIRDFARGRLPEAIARRVELPGASRDPASEYGKASIFALSSIREGQPNVILEAMSAGLPVCATATGGIPSLLGDNGALSPVGDANALAANLRMFLANPALGREQGAKNRETAKTGFSFEAMTRKHEDFILRLWEMRQ